jgi:dUTP pyrophosphatase
MKKIIEAIKRLLNTTVTVKTKIVPAVSNNQLGYNTLYSPGATIPVNIKLHHPDAKVPVQAKSGDIGYDVYAVAVDMNENYIEYDLGFAMELPPGWGAYLFPRSSITKKDLILKNSVGVLDEGWRGINKARFLMVNESENIYQPGERVGQIVFMPRFEADFTVVDHLSETLRGSDGWGSTNT